MKIETTEQKPKLDLTNPEGQRTQGHAEDVTDVLLNDSCWYPISPGSFKFYKTNKGVPFVQFDSALPSLDENGERVFRRIEVFPATVAGLAYIADTSVEVEENENGE